MQIVETVKGRLMARGKVAGMMSVDYAFDAQRTNECPCVLIGQCRLDKPTREHRRTVGMARYLSWGHFYGLPSVFLLSCRSLFCICFSFPSFFSKNLDRESVRVM